MMNRSNLIGAVVLLASAALAGCGAGFTSYCEDQNLCEEGNDLDIEACSIEWDTQAELAEIRNCGGEFDEYFDCSVENARCNDGRWGPDEDDCDAPYERLRRCVE